MSERSQCGAWATLTESLVFIGEHELTLSLRTINQGVHSTICHPLLDLELLVGGCFLPAAPEMLANQVSHGSPCAPETLSAP